MEIRRREKGGQRSTGVDKTGFSRKRNRDNARARRKGKKKKVEREKGTKGVAREEAKLCPQPYCSFASDRTD